MAWHVSILTALATGCIYSVMAVGVVLIYRTSRVLAFHVGEIGMLTAYILVSVWVPGGGFLNLGAAVIAAFGIAALSGVVMYVLVERIGGRLGHFVGTVITIAATIALNGLMGLVWAAQTWRMPLFPGTIGFFGVNLSIQNLAVILIGSAALVGIVVLIRHTSLGIDMQAIANNPALARLRGISVQKTLCAAWMMGSLLAALSGVMIASVSVVSVEGAVIGVSAIVAALIGGMTNVGFAIVGAFLLAGCETLVTLFGEPRFSQVIPVLGLLLLLVMRPTGLASRSENIMRV